MIKLCLKSHLNLSISFALLLLVLPATASADSLRPFRAVYSFYSGGMHLANSILRLEHKGAKWRFHSSTKARGFYAMFASKKVESETVFIQHETGVHLQQIKISDSGDKKKSELANFDWENRQLDIERKGKQKQLSIKGDVYDFQSIHLLAAAMKKHGVNSVTLDFYNRGKLVKSRFVYGGQGTVIIDGEKIKSNIYEQVTTGSNSTLKYYYDAEHPMLPLRIETLESGERSSVIAIQSVDWSL
jgi:hypothetical protein